ncbi:MAG: hypothetical protein KatS3mg099_423 [Candidatus Parcubacteria bacterium]|nr:MAG: hypothetical protein KatS3mg099_423 [Candidatus Parcubacteria bacterium]
MEQKQLTLVVALIALGVVALLLLPHFFGGNAPESATPPATTQEETNSPSTAAQEDAALESTTDADVQTSGVNISADASVQTAGGSASAQAGAQAQSEPVVVNVEGGKFYFKPDRIEVPQGATVRIVFNNVDGNHDWVIDEFNARTPVISTGETAEVTFVADKAGSFEYYCSVGNHRELGMKGTLVVTPGQ